MYGAHFPASAATSLIEGYCEDFVSFASILAQTLEQVSMRDLDIDSSKERLHRLEDGMRALADGIGDLLAGKRPNLPMGEGPTAPELEIAPVTLPPDPALAAAATAAPEPTAPPGPQRSTLHGPRPLVEARSTGHAAEFKGNNQSMPLLSVCQFLGRLHKNGIMHVFIVDEQVTFEFVNGCVQHTTSTGCPPNERIGEILVRMSACKERDIEQLARQSESTGKPLGDLILGSEIVSHGQLLEALEQQVQLRFSRACQTALASYEFEEGTCRPSDGRVRINVNELAWEQKKSVR